MKWDDIKLSLPQVISLGVLLLALYGVYFDLREKAKDALDLAQANQRALIELTVALRAKGVVQ
jgi:hypothetical protein